MGLRIFITPKIHRFYRVSAREFLVQWQAR
jgi:hypothetical protein